MDERSFDQGNNQFVVVLLSAGTHLNVIILAKKCVFTRTSPCVNDELGQGRSIDFVGPRHNLRVPCSQCRSFPRARGAMAPLLYKIT
jgi:hypothetical protein